MYTFSYKLTYNYRKMLLWNKRFSKRGGEVCLHMASNTGGDTNTVFSSEDQAVRRFTAAAQLFGAGLLWQAFLDVWKHSIILTLIANKGYYVQAFTKR